MESQLFLEVAISTPLSQSRFFLKVKLDENLDIGILCTLKRVSEFKDLENIVTADLKDNMGIERERRALLMRANMINRKLSRCTRQIKLSVAYKVL